MKQLIKRLSHRQHEHQRNCSLRCIKRKTSKDSGFILSKGSVCNIYIKNSSQQERMCYASDGTAIALSLDSITFATSVCDLELLSAVS